ncbi:hypothetical protein [Kibdelosporangium philippinense]|uniref:hypothetical protein n=1 Tax=Kibdelosporangium philippinense TaxID=211113 RepID=UPI00360D27C1
MKCLLGRMVGPLRHHGFAAWVLRRRCRVVDAGSGKGGHGVLERWTRCVGTVDTVCRNGGHGVPERWTRCAGRCISVCRSGGHGVLEWWTRRVEWWGWGLGW